MWMHVTCCDITGLAALVTRHTHAGTQARTDPGAAQCCAKKQPVSCKDSPPVSPLPAAGAVAADGGAVPHGLPRLHHHTAGGGWLWPSLWFFCCGCITRVRTGSWWHAAQPSAHCNLLSARASRRPAALSAAASAALPGCPQAGADPSLRHPASGLSPAGEAASFGEAAALRVGVHVDASHSRGAQPACCLRHTAACHLPAPCRTLARCSCC